MPTLSEVRIVPATADEADAVATMVAAVFAECIAPCYSVPGRQEFLKYAAAEGLRARLRQGHHTWLAKTGSALVGMIEVREPDHISLFFVASGLRRQGIGRQLLQTAREWILAQHPGAESITVNASPNAVGAYECLGFTRMGETQERHGIRYVPMEAKAKPA